MKKILIWICILAFAGIIDTCFYVIKSSESIENMHNTTVAQTTATGMQTPTHAKPKESVVGALFSSDGPSHSKLVSENAKYNLTNSEMELYNNSATFSAAATTLYTKLEESVYTSYNVDKLGYRTVVNLNNFVTYEGIRYYRVYNYYSMPMEGTLANPEGLTNPNGTIYNYTGLLSTYYICASGQQLNVKEAQSDGTQNPLNSGLSQTQTENQIKKVMTEYVKGKTSMPGVTASVYLNSNTIVSGKTYYQTTLTCPSGKQNEFQLRGSEHEAIMFADPSGRIWQTKDQAYLYSGYYYEGLRFDGQTFFYNAFNKKWGK
ncbi:hypothetical protein [uncultured Clostridium sp.]|jgi:hypothetical protein|uniref:hypothetical protein n=1 Tax=uncultured Clostridium sp. TaxID=59620 RepID=UPI002619DAF1|nr:hypothetical protein [uncultured Clostridium sp.]